MGEKRIIVITGATGTGKTTVQHYLCDKYQIPRIITHTTRPKRDGERDGVDYYFETQSSFFNNHYIEHVEYSGYRYGSSREGLQRAWAKSDVVSIVLDTAGALTYVQQLGAAVAVMFLTIDDPAVLRQRLLDRGDAAERVAARLRSKEYARDLELPRGIQHVARVIMNDNWELARLAVDQFVAELGIKPNAKLHSI